MQLIGVKLRLSSLRKHRNQELNVYLGVHML